LRAAENDFEGTRTTILWVRDATGQGGDWGAFVQVHTGRGQDTCISEQARRTRRTPTASGVDCVKTVGHARGVKTVGSVGVDGTSSLIGLSSFAGAAHTQDADGQWNRLCEDGGVHKRCEGGGVRRIIGSKQGSTIWGSMDTMALSMMDAAAAGSAAGP